MFYLNDCARKLRAGCCCCRQQYLHFSLLASITNKTAAPCFYIFATLSGDLRRGCPLFRFAFYVYRHSGRTGGVPVTIGIAPPPMLMAGRSHCLRRFYHARTMTERKFHYIQILATELLASIGRCSACGAGVFRSLSVTLKSDHPLPRKERSWRTRRPAPCMPLLAVCIRLVPYSILKVQ